MILLLDKVYLLAVIYDFFNLRKYKKYIRNKQPSLLYGDEIQNVQVIAKYHERYSRLIAKLLDKQYTYQLDPRSHPQYQAEWNTFWARRQQDFFDAGNDPYNHDFTQEWRQYWFKRMKQIDIETIDRCEKEIRIALNLPQEFNIPSLENEIHKIFDQESNNVSNRNHKRSALHFGDQSKNKRFKKNSNNRNTDVSPFNASDLRQVLSQQESTYEDRRMSDYQQDRNDQNNEYRQEISFNQDYIDPNSSSSLNFANNNTEDSITILSAVRLVAAFEDFLGNSLGPKVLDLLSKAVALDKVRKNLSNDWLPTEDNHILLETVKEKMKGLLLTGFINPAQMPVAHQVIDHVNTINKIVELRIKARTKRANRLCAEDIKPSKVEL